MKTQTHIFFRSAVLFALMFASQASAHRRSQPLVLLSAPQYSGTGCQATTLSSVLSPNATALSMLFDSFVVDVDATTRIARKSCNIAIPMQVPSGFRVSVIGIDYRGFNNLPVGAKAELLVDYAFSGGSVAPFNTTFYGPLLENYFLQNTLSTANQVWSSCGGDTVLRGNKALILTANEAGEEASSTVDSIEVTASDATRTEGMTLYFHWQTCTTAPNTTAPSQPSAASSLQPHLMALSYFVALCTLITVGI